MRLNDAIITSSLSETFSFIAGGYVIGNADLDAYKYYFLSTASLRQKNQLCSSIVDFLTAKLPATEDWVPVAPISPLERLAMEAIDGEA